MPSHQLSNRDFLNYKDLANLFADKPNEFIIILKVIHEDFLNNHIQIMDAISECSLVQFRRVYNNLRANINLFDMLLLRELMNKLESRLEDGQTDNKEINEELHSQFNLISLSLEKKIKELS